jgi:signal transduction histidine kinase
MVRALIFGYAVLLLLLSVVLSGCGVPRTDIAQVRPAIEFTGVPISGEGTPLIESTIKGRVLGARAGQRIVLYARALNDNDQAIWFVQPFVRHPFTEIHSNSRWRNLTHPGLKYAALLVEPGFQPPRQTHTLPTQGVVAVAITSGWPPTQNWWFPLACAMAAAAVIFGLHRVWLYQATKELNLSFEARLMERERIARELHDTLLQSFQGLLLRFQTVSNLLPEHPAEAKRRLESAVDQAALAISEGREAIQQLRSSAVVTDDLALALRTLGEELAAEEPNRDSAVLRVGVEGTPRNLHPILRDEIYRIAGEALRNAFRHAQARRIEVEIRYSARQLRLRIRDNGKGVDPALLNAVGRPGHWGLLGMHERAKLLGGNLNVWSKLASGTEVELSVPASVAYPKPSASRRLRLGGGERS